MRDPLAEPSDLIRSVSRALRVLESVGRAPRGLTVKQIARRCELTVATTYHLVRTLAYEGYVIRREDGTYIVGLEVADRYRELVAAFRSPAVGESLRRVALETGWSHVLGRFVGGQVAITAVAEGSRSPYLEDLVPGFDEGAHATALGKALLATLTTEQRQRYLREYGMRPFTSATLTTPEAFEADLTAGERRGMQLELGQFRQGVACAAVLVCPDKDMERRTVLACTLPASEMMTSARVVRTKLLTAARAIAEGLAADS
ncbi:IclR family transcriptional regulator [Micromonospora sp. DT48]|uniref:IclR family transcriptional regulator n=1 Tax=unclassified Micromonospora TaxID=2617518 RepID=UPI0013271FE7|nr:IclR family transcriptional regulator C-terminal domain-containing protein [Micromonospora sp. CP22]MTK02748.1 MarR family transcriptional regulator [Micromonospora sp. CP22]